MHVYLPQDRLSALATDTPLPDRTSGSALFADISGFTALTESLREKLGTRQGAEELTRRLGAVYSALIAEIETYGGSVIGFAGDSMLCWFDEELLKAQPGARGLGTAYRAVVCAFRMQEAIQAFQGLGLKVAIASGGARRFVVGDADIRRIDALAGATVARTALGEHLASKGDVLVDEVTASALGEAVVVREWRSDEESGERFALVGQGARSTKQKSMVLEPQTAAVGPEALRPFIHRAVYDRETSGQGAFLTEFRPCVALFVRFTGIDYEADDAQAALDKFVKTGQSVAERHDGTFLQLTIGDKGSYLYISFGALSAHEDDARRAVKTALELRNRTELRLQVGITQGLMRVGAYGGQTRKTFGALGDDVNLAARLMAIARGDEILVGGHVYKVVQDEFTFEPRPPLPMKGRAEPMPVFAVTGESRKRAVRLQEPTYALPMVGRQTELKRIEEKLDLAKEGKSQVIGIVAEAGLGKSRLVAEVTRSARRKGFTGFGGACQSDGIHTPYLAWKGIWQAFFDVDHEMALGRQMRLLQGDIEEKAPSRVEALPLLNAVFDLDIPENDFTKDLEPKLRKSALHALLEECLRAQAADEPMLIVIEDLHWIDALSRDLLEELAMGLATSAVCFVLAYRPPELERLQRPRIEALPQFTRIALHELTTSEAENAIRAKLLQLYPARGGSLPPGLVDALMARAQGNPFYLEELLNYVRDRGLDPSDIENIELPDSLHTLILSRIDGLSEQEKTTLRAASIIGRLFRANWLTGYYPELGTPVQVKAALDELDRLEITPLDSEPELAYLFKHIVTHEVTYESLPFATRARLHEQLAKYLENQFDVGASHTPSGHLESPLLDTITSHYLRSENQEKQIEYLRKAGEAAQKNFANDVALEYYGALLPLLQDPKEQTQIYLRRGEVLELQGKYDEAESDCRSALELSKDDVASRANAQFGLGRLNRLRGKYDIALDMLGQVRISYDDLGQLSDSAKALNEMGLAYIRKTQLDSAHQVLDESIKLARQAADSAREAQALTYLGSIAWQRGDYGSAQSLYEQSLKLQRALRNKKDLSSLLHSLGMVEQSLGDFAKARALFEESLELAHVTGDKSGSGWAMNNLGIVALVQGEYATAKSLFEKHLAIRRELGDEYGRSIALYLLGRWAQSQGNFDAAKSFFEEHMNIRSKMNDKFGLGYSLLNQGLVAYYQHQYELAQGLFHKSLKLMQKVKSQSGVANVLFGFGIVSLERLTAEGIAEAKEYFVSSLNLRREMGEKLQLTSSLIGMARYDLSSGSPLRAAELLGAVDAVVKPLHITVEPDLLHFHAQTLTAVQEALGEEAFRSAWEEGARWSLDEAVGRALGDEGN